MAGFVGLPPPTSKVTDMRALVAAYDSTFRDPQVVYEYSNGRKFKEFPQTDQAVYGTENRQSLYIPTGSAAGAVFYGATGLTNGTPLA